METTTNRSTTSRVRLTTSAKRVRPGRCVMLDWNVIGIEANIASIHLSIDIKDGPQMIECVAPQGSREIIFPTAGTFSFTLTATFGDGVKRSEQVSVRVG